MADIPGGGLHNIARAGRRLRRKVVAAVGLTVFAPLALLGYGLLRVAPQVRAGQPLQPGWLPLLVAATVIGMLAGAYLLWDVGRTVSGMARAVGTPRPVPGPGGPQDGIDTAQSINRMLGTIEQQAQEIHALTTRLDAAYRELESTHTRLREASFKDDVTGLYNRRFFSLRLEEELSRFRRFNHPLSVVLLDLDGFKAVNDDFGHAVGDATLRDVAQILMKHSRGINVVSRYGGDEFAVLLVETSKAGARLYADRMREVVATFPFSHGKPVTASFGVASLPDDEAATTDELFRLADEALYAAKRAGKNQVAVAPGAAARVV